MISLPQLQLANLPELDGNVGVFGSVAAESQPVVNEIIVAIMALLYELS